MAIYILFLLKILLKTTFVMIKCINVLHRHIFMLIVTPSGMEHGAAFWLMPLIIDFHVSAPSHFGLVLVSVVLVANYL